MGAFELIEKKEYDAFCSLYLEKAYLRKTQSEYADLISPLTTFLFAPIILVTMKKAMIRTSNDEECLQKAAGR